MFCPPPLTNIYFHKTLKGQVLFRSLGLETTAVKGLR